MMKQRTAIFSAISCNYIK